MVSVTSITLCTAVRDTWMGKTPLVRPKSAISTHKRDDKHPRIFYMEDPPRETVTDEQNSRLTLRLQDGFHH